jgi:hypothetical protein
MEHQHRYSWRIQNSKRRSPTRANTKSVGEEECQTKEAVRRVEGEGDI